MQRLSKRLNAHYVSTGFTLYTVTFIIYRHFEFCLCVCVRVRVCVCVWTGDYPCNFQFYAGPFPADDSSTRLFCDQGSARSFASMECACTIMSLVRSTLYYGEVIKEFHSDG